MYITTVVLLFYRSQLYHILSLINGKKNPYSSSKHWNWLGIIWTTGGNRKEIPTMIPLQLPLGQKSGNGQHSLTVIFPTCHTEHNSGITKNAQYTLWYLSRVGVFSHLPPNQCMQSSNCPATVLFLVVLIVPLPPFLKFVELINWVLTLIKNKNML